MSRHTVYLAGPIAGVSGASAVNWRDKCAIAFNEFDVSTFSPMRGKEALRRAPRISTDYYDYFSFGPFYEPRGIMARDYNDVSRADVILVNFLGAERVSIGTCMEIAWAYEKRIPVVAVMEPLGNPHDTHPMLESAIGFRVETLDEALGVVLSVLGE